MPVAASDDEPDWITGFLHDRLLDGLFEERAEDQEDSKRTARRSRREPEGPERR